MNISDPATLVVATGAFMASLWLGMRLADMVIAGIWLVHTIVMKLGLTNG